MLKMTRLTVLWTILIYVLALVARTDAVTEDQFHELAVRFEAMEKQVIQLTETGKLGLYVRTYTYVNTYIHRRKTKTNDTVS